MMRHFVPPRNNIVRYNFNEDLIETNTDILRNKARNWPASLGKVRPQPKLKTLEGYYTSATYSILDNGSLTQFYITVEDLLDSSYGYSVVKKSRTTKAKALNLMAASYDDLVALSNWAINDYVGIYSSVLPAYYDNEIGDYNTCLFEEYENLTGTPFVLRFCLGGYETTLNPFEPITDSGAIRNEMSISAWHNGVILTGMGEFTGIYTYNGRYLMWPYEDGSTPGYTGEPLQFGWHHYVLNYRQEQDEVVCHTYVDGVRRDREAGSFGIISTEFNTIQSLLSQSVVTLGSSGNSYEDTQVSDIRLYNRCLSQGEVEDMYDFDTNLDRYSSESIYDWQTVS